MKSSSLISTLLIGLLFAGCDPGNRTNGSVGAIATTNGACPVGSWYSNGQCYNGTGTTNSAFNFGNGHYADNYSGTTRLKIVNATKMTEFYKLGMGVCDRAHKNIGQANCSYYLSGYTDIILQFPTQTNDVALLTVIARPRTSSVNYSGQIPSGWGLLGIALGYTTGHFLPDPSYYQGAYRNPLQIQMAVSPINNSTGFSAQGYGDAWTGLNQTLVTIEVANGNKNSVNLNYAFKIGGVTAAQGTMTQCRVVNCGL